jgi:hypothetical protein
MSPNLEFQVGDRVTARSIPAKILLFDRPISLGLANYPSLIGVELTIAEITADWIVCTRASGQKIHAYLDSGESIELLYRSISLSPIPACQCGRCGLPEYLQDEDGDRLYECATCKRMVPFCYGEFQKMPDSCDDCFCATYGGDE